jgi:hypothetical protein
MIVSIQSVQSWNRGTVTTLNVFRLQSINDNLRDSCTFYWQIGNEVPLPTGGTTQTWVQDGNLTMNGADYTGWNGSNDAAMSWALSQLNLSRTLVGMVATPIPTSPLLKGGALPQ